MAVAAVRPNWIGIAAWLVFIVAAAVTVTAGDWRTGTPGLVVALAAWLVVDRQRVRRGD